MIAFLGVVSLFLTPVFLVIMVIQAIRKKKVKKWAIALGVCLLCFVFCLVIDGGNIEPAAPKTVESEEKQEETKEPVVESEEESEIVEEVSEEVKNFAEENGISFELAQSVEKVLLETDIPDSLNILNGWEQTEDYAYGQRYIAQSYSLAQDKYFYVMFYVQDDEVVSVRDRKNNLEVLWSSEE